MRSHTRQLFTAACFLLTISRVLSIDTVSISSLYPSSQHGCVTHCIFANFYTDIGNALRCGSPYANNCFCNTAPASASVASSWLAACGSSSCSAGDVSDDLTSMHSIYASYCIGAGFTQPGATDWYNPGSATAIATGTAIATANPGQTAKSGPGATTTQVTVVTQTAPSTAGSAATQPQVTIHTTSTLFVGSNGSPVPAPSDSGPSKLALGLGLGLGIPLALMIAGVAIWLCLKGRRRSPPGPAEYLQPPMQQPTAPDQVLPPPPPSIQRKAVPVQTTELTADGVRRELSARESNPFPSPVSPSAPGTLPGDYEMSGEGQAGELPVQARSPPPGYSHPVGYEPELEGQAHGHGQVGESRWELA